MVSRAQLVVVTIIVAVGLIGPMSFIAQEASRSPAESAVPTNTTAPKKTQTVQVAQILEYTATTEAEIVSVNPVLAVVVVSDKAYNQTVANLSSVPFALQSLDGEDNVFRAVYSLGDALDYYTVIPLLEEMNFTVADRGMSAEIALPESFTATRSGKDYTLYSSPSDEVTAVISGEQQSGYANFSLEIRKAGNKLTVAAHEL